MEAYTVMAIQRYEIRYLGELERVVGDPFSDRDAAKEHADSLAMKAAVGVFFEGRQDSPVWWTPRRFAKVESKHWPSEHQEDWESWDVFTVEDDNGADMTLHGARWTRRRGKSTPGTWTNLKVHPESVEALIECLRSALKARGSSTLMGPGGG